MGSLNRIHRLNRKPPFNNSGPCLQSKRMFDNITTRVSHINKSFWTKHDFFFHSLEEKKCTEKVDGTKSVTSPSTFLNPIM